MTKPIRFGLTYLAVLAAMLVWWAALVGAAKVGWALLLTIAYLTPIAVWSGVTSWGWRREESSP